MGKRSGALLLALLFGAYALAQEEAEDSGIFELSPFQVDGSGDEGYRASATTAGSRFNTELKDVAASVTVLTEAFLDDLGATDLAMGLSMVAGTETEITTDETTTSLSQGYLGSDFGDRNTSEGSVRVRGLGNATNAANFIEVRGAPDRYNIERAEFLRGPNSILFGLAQPAGLVNYSTKRARLGANFNQVNFVLDNFGSVRGVVDVSRMIKEDVLAIRAVAMHSNSKYMFDTAYQKDNRLFLTSTYKPFESTSLTAFYEKGGSDGRRPNYRLLPPIKPKTIRRNSSSRPSLSSNRFRSTSTPFCRTVARTRTSFARSSTVALSGETFTRKQIVCSCKRTMIWISRRSPIGLRGSESTELLAFTQTIPRPRIPTATAYLASRPLVCSEQAISIHRNTSILYFM